MPTNILTYLENPPRSWCHLQLIRVLQHTWCLYLHDPPTYLSIKLTMLLTTHEGIAYVLSKYIPPPSTSSNHFYPFMKIHETRSIHLLHIVDQLWCDGDLNDNQPSFCNNTFIWGHDNMGHLLRNLDKKWLIKSLEFLHVWWRRKRNNDFGWMMKV